MKPLEYKRGNCGKAPFQKRRSVINHQNRAHGGNGKILIREEGDKEWT